MGAPGGLYRATPRGYNGKLAQHGSLLSVSLAAVFSADSWGPPLAGPADVPGRCSHASDDVGLVRGSWQQCRRPAGDHCGHSPSYLVNGAQDPWEGRADSQRPTPTRSVFGRTRLFTSPTD